MILAIALSGGAAPAPAVAWTTDYAAAYERSKLENKPILVVFTNAADKAEGVADLAAVADRVRDFVPVFASKRSTVGQSLYSLFAINGDEATVVVEKNRAWQFCRYERKLSRNELDTVLKNTASASGAPVADPLGGKSYYFNPQTQPAGTATPAWNQPTVLGSGWTTDGSYCPSCQRRGR
ncbi:MAG TPA: hypothetical protein VNC50_16480 [Planctomycetia bacterium]|nr:hypothetical protein [Planctomycetia bacterium]